MEKKEGFKEVKVYVAANGYTLAFSDHQGGYNSKTFFVAKTLDEVKRLCQQHLLPPKFY